ncbi:TonB-dependent receptor [Citromicrobium bathyomarinum]|uniref:TonB-dependent receptor n=1 Tax=Citromicrobium bathyomarinum TaxID=72174 RepID=UPI001E4AE143|nr:TonB-dependent receptor [Citromicrobium bathyomarinum]MCD1623143.1 TonB-dependent receptor [Citromicrobium bathyomarinum]
MNQKFAYSASLVPLVALLSAQPALAQQATATDARSVISSETIVVTGRRSVVTPGEAIKEVSPAIVDSITSEDIEQTADITLPEALDRVVGVSSDGFFSSSDPGYVSLRGFDSRYNSMEIDGNPIWFSSQNNRGAQIGMFPSAIVKETSVYKTVLPDMDANSVGGHIALRTLRAFDGGTQPYFKAGGRIGFAENDSRVSEQQSYQVYGAGKFTFGPDNNFGAVFGFNRQHTADYDDLGASSGYSQLGGFDGEITDIIRGNVFSADSAVDKETRNTALFGKLEARSTDAMYAFLSFNYFDETKDYYIQRAGAYIAPNGSRTVTPTGPGTADFTNGNAQIREYDYVIERSAFVVGAGLDLRVADRGVLVLRGNYTDFSNDTLTRNLGNGFRIGSIDGSYDISGDVPVITPADPALYNDLASWKFNNGGSGAYNRYQPLRDNVYTLGAKFNFNNQPDAEGLGGSVGVNWVRLDRSFDEQYEYYKLNSGVALGFDQVASGTMENNQAALQDYDAFWDFMYNPANAKITTDDRLTSDYTLREDIIGLHAAATYATGSFKLLVGLRYEHTTDDTLTGQIVSGTEQPLDRHNQYGKWLPNVQAGIDATDRLKLRAAFTQTLGRADFADFAPGITTTIGAAGETIISGTNGELDTRVSTNYDASIEYYLDDGVLAVALFHKDLDGEIFDQRTEFYDGEGMLTEVRTVPLNNGMASVTGIELTANKRRLDFLPAPFDRLGIAANFTYMDATWDVVFTDGSTRSVPGLRNQPEWMSSARASYDFGPVDINLNYRGRGRAFTGSFGTSAESDRYVRQQHFLDFQLNVRAIDKLRITFDAKNLTDEYQIQTTGINDSIYNSLGRGREFWLGLHYKY